MRYALICLMMFLAACCSCNPIPTPEPQPEPEPDPVHSPVIPTPDPTSKLLYNGITLPSVWPPRSSSSKVLDGMDPFYLSSKPSVIDISIGRQLFVDDFLISSTTLKRVWHQAEYYASNPVLKPEKSWELTDDKGAGSAAPFSDGVWYDEKDSKFKMWYMAPGTNPASGYCATCYAESSDGINWIRPDLKVEPGTNIVSKGKERDSNTTWIDKTEKDASKRFKMFDILITDGVCHSHYMTSSDGKAWREVNESAEKVMDRSTVFYNPFRGVWVWSLRHNIRLDANTLVRSRDYMENADVEAGNRAAAPDLNDFWFGSWPSDPRHPSYPDVQPGIYNLDAIGYESVMLGVFSVWSGPENEVCKADNVIKRNQLMLGFSRDGWNWYREDFTPFCAVSDDANAWNHGNIQSAVGSPLIVGDKLYFYMSGRRKNADNNEVISTGLATLRRDGFASMSGSGELTTEKLNFKGGYFYLNAAVRGSLKVEVLDAKGTVIPGYSYDECNAIAGDKCKVMVTWKEHSDLKSLQGQNIKVKFYLKDADLYSFWISQTADGKSCGYTAGGGPSLGEYGVDL